MNWIRFYNDTWLAWLSESTFSRINKNQTAMKLREKLFIKMTNAFSLIKFRSRLERFVEHWEFFFDKKNLLLEKCQKIKKLELFLTRTIREMPPLSTNSSFILDENRRMRFKICNWHFNSFVYILWIRIKLTIIVLRSKGPWVIFIGWNEKMSACKKGLIKASKKLIVVSKKGDEYVHALSKDINVTKIGKTNFLNFEFIGVEELW